MSALSKHAYACSESGDGKFRLVIGFNSREELMDAHEELARQVVALKSQPAEGYGRGHRKDCTCGYCQ